MHANLQRLAKLPPETQVYCAHEYTLSNARYAHVAEPDNEDIAKRLVAVELMRDKGEPTVPTTIGEERATNPFMRANTPDQLAERRAVKDTFIG
jgi:hydroxyacylglutathione hydrolase